MYYICIIDVLYMYYVLYMYCMYYTIEADAAKVKHSDNLNLPENGAKVKHSEKTTTENGR